MNAGLFRGRLAVWEDGSPSDRHPILRGRGLWRERAHSGISPQKSLAPGVSGTFQHSLIVPEAPKPAQEDRANLVWVGLGRSAAFTALLQG